MPLSVRGFFFFSSRRRHTRYWRDWSSDVCSSDLSAGGDPPSGDDHHQVGPGAEESRHSRADGAAAAGERGAVGDVAHPRSLADARTDRKSVVSGKSVDLGGRRIIKKKNLLQRSRG